MRKHLVARARAVAGSPDALPEDFIIYVCQKCGRLIEYVSLPCMCCGWRPTTLFEMSHSGCLNNRIFSLWDLLVIGREIAAGRKATDVVPKLAQVAAKKMADPQSRQDIEIVLQTAEKKFDTYFFWHDAAVCENCGTHNPRQDAKECQKCKGRLRLSPPLRLLMCLTRTLDHFQGSFEAPKSKEFNSFIRFLVILQSKLYRTQETPSHLERIQVLDLMSKLARFELSNGIAEIIMTNPQKISSHLRDGLPDEQKPQCHHGACRLYEYLAVPRGLDEPYQRPFVTCFSRRANHSMISSSNAWQGPRLIQTCRGLHYGAPRSSTAQLLSRLPATLG